MRSIQTPIEFQPAVRRRAARAVGMVDASVLAPCWILDPAKLTGEPAP